MAEGKGNAPNFHEDFDGWAHWYRTPPKAHHLIYWDGDTQNMVHLESAQGISSFHIQRFGKGWVLGERRGGRTLIYDGSGSLIKTLDLGDASEDLQTTPDGMIWVSYFDEGVFGGGIGAQGLICFDGDGMPLFRFAEFAEKNQLPPIYDCYAMNVAPSGDVWLNYYNEFPLVQLKDFKAKGVWTSFHCMDKGFAIRGSEAIYLRHCKFFAASLGADGESEELLARDDRGMTLAISEGARAYATGRGSNFLVNSGEALYELYDQTNEV